MVIATKTMSRTARAVTQDVERFLREIGTDVVDIVLLHFVTQRDWPMRYRGAMDALARAKSQGKVRAVGVSCHGVGALRAAAETDWAEVVLARINAVTIGISRREHLDENVKLVEELTPLYPVRAI